MNENVAYLMDFVKYGGNLHHRGSSHEAT